jgi:hypothetical protein
MGKKIFVSYKYSDSGVCPLPGLGKTTVRNYVDILQSKIDASDHIYKGEDDGEDLSSLEDSTIGSKLGDKIFDSTVTIVFISKGMRTSIPDKEQWMPWEISYSLREQSRAGIRSKTNAMLAVVLPDYSGSYEYFLQYNPACNSTTYRTEILFDILRENMFNKLNPKTKECNGSVIHYGDHSYIQVVRWDNFIQNINHYIDSAISIWRVRDEYNLRKNV